MHRTRLIGMGLSLVLFLCLLLVSPLSAQATNCSGSTWPSRGSLQTSNWPGSNQYSATFQFKLTADELCSLQQKAPYLEIDFQIRNFDVPAEWEGYSVVGTNLPGALHDAAVSDPQYIANPAVTRIYTSQLQVNTTYYATLSWTANARSGMAPYITFVWSPSHWAYANDPVQTGACVRGGNFWPAGDSRNPNEAWCINPVANNSVILFGNKTFSGGFSNGALPLDGFRWYNWDSGGDTEGIGNPVSLPVALLPPLPGKTIFINGGGSAHAGPGTTNWTQLTPANGALKVAAGGGRVAVTNGCGSTSVTDNLVNWTQITPCNGTQHIAVGSSGRVVFTNGGGATYASDNLVDWTQLTPANGTLAIAIGGNRVAVTNGCGSTSVTDNLVNWTQITPCNGTMSVAVGATGRVAFINGCGGAYTSDNLVNWTQITPCNGATKIAVGGSRVVFTNGGGETYASDNVQDWVRLTPPNGTMLIAAGNSGRVAVTNGCGSTNVTDNLVNWTQITPCNGTSAVALG